MHSFSATSAPVRLKGSAASTEIGWTNELNWLARIMYAMATPMIRANISSLNDSVIACALPERLTWYPSGSSSADFFTTWSTASACDFPAATLAKTVIARSRPRRVIARRLFLVSILTRVESGTSVPSLARTLSSPMSSSRDRWPETSRTRMS